MPNRASGVYYGFIRHPDALNERAPSFNFAPLEPLRAVAKKRLAAVLEAPAGFDVSGLDIRTAALAGVESHLLAVCLVFGERDRVHIDTGGGVFVHFGIGNREDLYPGAAEFLNLALGCAAVATEP